MTADTERERKEKLMEVMEKVAPGTDFRESVDRILQVGSGALIVAGPLNELRPIMSGGFSIECEFTPPRMYELAKMDGAVILSRDLNTIHNANVHLMPDPSIPTEEAGTRHRTAERVARQTSAFVIAISEKMNTVSLYLDEDHFTLESIPLALAKADQALTTLGRYRARLDEKYSLLTTLEMEDLVTLRDVVKVVRRSEMVMRIADDIQFRVSELGKDGRLVSLQMGELMSGVEMQQRMLVKDYCMPHSESAAGEAMERLKDLSGDDLVSETSVAVALGYKGSSELLNKFVRPRGYRVLSMVPRIPSNVVDNLVDRFDNLRNIMRASTALLEEVDGVGDRRAVAIREGLDRILE